MLENLIHERPQFPLDLGLGATCFEKNPVDRHRAVRFVAIVLLVYCHLLPPRESTNRSFAEKLAAPENVAGFRVRLDFHGLCSFAVSSGARSVRSCFDESGIKP